MAAVKVDVGSRVARSAFTWQMVRTRDSRNLVVGAIEKGTSRCWKCVDSSTSER
jgi:hypothetical protein